LAILAIIQAQAYKREEWVERFFQVMNGWNLYCSLSIIQVHACKEEEEEEKEEWGMDFQLMNE
jgi:hypothetical protein